MTSTAEIVLQVIALVIASSFAFIGNVFVILVIRRHPQMKNKVTSLFMVNLAVADISVSLINVPFMIASTVYQRWIFGDALCQLTGYLNVLFCGTSMMTLSAISMDRYFAVMKPGKKVVTRKRAYMMIAYVWIHTAVAAFPPLVGWNEYAYTQTKSHCVVHWQLGGVHLGYSVFIVFVAFQIPLTAMAYTYYKVINVLRRQRKLLNARQLNSTQNKGRMISERESKLTRTVLIVIFVFLTCWAPYCILNLWAGFSSDDIPLAADVITTWLAYFNSACNPVIYGVMNKNFREGFKQILCCNLNKVGSGEFTHTNAHENSTMQSVLDKNVTSQPQRESVMAVSDA